jgi:tRNA modification GTPase
MQTDTIVAVATAAGPAAIAVVRLSGPGAFRVAGELAAGFDGQHAREARLLTVRDATGPIDRALVTAFPAPASFTGEDVVEFSCHGGAFTAARVLSACLACGAREAFAGEFTRRAVLHGKLDLLQAEATGDLLMATAPAQAAQALAQLDGNLSRRILELREVVLQAEALLAYEIDFPGEDDGPVPHARLESMVAGLRKQLEGLLATAADGERVRSGALVVLTGPPNAGKSSLFNALLGRDRAMVTATPGTTRDAIEADTTFDGYPVRLVDTAGIRAGGDELEQLGMERSHRWAADADLVIACTPPDTERNDESLTTFSTVVVVGTKADLRQVAFSGGVAVSALTGQGLNELRTLVARRLFGDGLARSTSSSEPLLTRERHRDGVAKALAAVAHAEEAMALREPVLAASSLRGAADALMAMIGVTNRDDVLDRVFAGFCIGK